MQKKIRIISLILAVWLIAGAIIALSACKDPQDDGDGEDDGGGEFDPYPYEDLSVFMDTPDYKNVTLSSELVERMVNTELAYFYRDAKIDIPVYGASAKWDTVDISVTGFIDGGLEPELSGENMLLVLGSDTFYIDGFEEGLIGLSSGEIKGLTLTFPTDYEGTAFAGKTVEYTVTVNAVYRAPVLTDDLCSEKTGFRSAAEYLEWVRKRCIFLYVWDGLTKKCVIKGYPDVEYAEYYQYLKGYFQTLAESEGMTFADFISKYGGSYSEYGLFSGMTVLDFENVATNYAKSNLVNDLLTYSIIRKEGIKTEGEEFEAAKATLEKELMLPYSEIVKTSGKTEALISVLSVRLCEVINGYVTVTNE